MEFEKKEKTLTLSESQLKTIRSVLAQIQQSVGYLNDVFALHQDTSFMSDHLNILTKKMDEVMEEAKLNRGETIEGVFDGEKMVGQDGVLYDVPANYASKSKLIEGDIMKLTISPDGDYIYKQIFPVERKRVVGALGVDQESGYYYVMNDDKAYKVIPASVSFFQGKVGDEVILLVPKDGTSAWAAIENIVKK